MKTSWIHSPWTIGITCTVLSFAGPGIYDLYKEKPFFSTIWNVLKWCWNSIIYVLNFDLKVWWILVFLIALILILLLIASFENKEDENTGPDFCNYQEEIIDGWKFTWKWDYFNSCWNVVHLKVHCPKCDTPMVMNSFLPTCVRCNYVPQTSIPLESDKVKLLIYDNIRRKYKT